MAQRTCSYEGCERPHLARGWCGTHYTRWQKHGDPSIVAPRYTLTVDERFWAKVDKSAGPEGCWLWTGGTTGGGYGNFALDGRLASKVWVLAHIYAYESAVGRVPDGLVLDHTCHNGSGCPGGSSCPHRKCVNPAHLDPTEFAQNVLRGEGPSAVNARRTHCIHGHEYTPENTIIEKAGRRCRACRSAWRSVYDRKRRSAA